jgi:hypothetical protein
MQNDKVTLFPENRSIGYTNNAEDISAGRSFLQQGNLHVIYMSELPVDTVPFHRPQCMNHPCIKNNNKTSRWSRSLYAALLPVLLP